MSHLYDRAVRWMNGHGAGCCGCYLGCCVVIVAPVAAALGLWTVLS